MGTVLDDSDPRVLFLGEEIDALLSETPDITVTLGQREWVMANWMVRYVMDVHLKEQQPALAISTMHLGVALNEHLTTWRDSATPMALEDADAPIAISDDSDFFYALFATAVNIIVTQNVTDHPETPGSIGAVGHSLIRHLGPQLPDGVAAKTYERFGAEDRF